MANWLNIAGGAAQGYVQGDEDNRRRREFESMQRQRNRVEKQQKEDDELAATLKQVRAPGTYTDEDTSPETGTVGPPSPSVSAARPKTTTKVSEADYNRNLATAYGKSARPQDIATAATLRNAARSAEQGDRTERQAQAQDVLLQAGRLKAAGDNVGAARLLQQAYKNYPDGHEIVIEDRNGVAHSAIAGPDGKFVTAPAPITSESVQAMINEGMSMTSPQMYQEGQKLGIQREELGLRREANAIARQNADTVYKEMLFKTGDEAKAKLAAETAYAQAHARYMDAAKGAVGASANAARFGQSVPFTDGKGGTVYMTPVRDPKTGQVTWQRENMPEGLTPFKQPQQLSDMQKALLEIHKKKSEAGAFKTPVEEEAALMAIIGSGGGAGGGFFDTLNKGDPSKQVGPPTPTAAEKATANPKPKRAETKEEAEARRQKEKFLKPGAVVQTTPAELNAQLEAQVQAANRR